MKILKIIISIVLICLLLISSTVFASPIYTFYMAFENVPLFVKIIFILSCFFAIFIPVSYLIYLIISYKKIRREEVNINKRFFILSFLLLIVLISVILLWYLAEFILRYADLGQVLNLKKFISGNSGFINTPKFFKILFIIMSLVLIIILLIYFMILIINFKKIKKQENKGIKKHFKIFAILILLLVVLFLNVYILFNGTNKVLNSDIEYTKNNNPDILGPAY